MRIVATAGHVDHGKSTLVRALTGMEPDRLAEEQRRGLTVDLGFAWTTLPAAGAVAFVDVPGHVDFIKNMLAGVAVVQACILVVDAWEGWREQTEEHFRILELAGVTEGLVAVTKRALVEHTRVADLVREIEQRTANSFLDGKPIVACDALSGLGLDELRDALDRALAALVPPLDRGRPRLWVDRSFSIAGAGTVVTGGLAHGSIAAGDHLVVVGAGDPLTVRVRGLESLGTRRSRVEAGSRTAINLANVSPEAIPRGSALVRAGDWHVTSVVDVALHVLGNLTHPVTPRGAFLAYVGSGEHPVTLRILQGDAIDPGTSGWARIRLPRPLPLAPGDHFVLRESGRGETVGGGEILDVAPVTRLSHATPDRSPERVVRERGWVEVDEFTRLTGLTPTHTVGRWIVDDAVLAARRAALVQEIEAAPVGVDIAALDEHSRAVLALIVAEGTIEVRTGIAMVAGRAPSLAEHPYLSALGTAPFAPPQPSEFGLRTDEHAALVRMGLVVSEGGLSFSYAAVLDAGRMIIDALAEQPEGLTVGDVRDLLGVSRKWVLPLLACLDRMEITTRVGDRRVAGRKAAILH